MLFQVLDEKKRCVGVYCNGEIVYNELPKELSSTWSYAGFLENLDIEYANLYLGGKKLEDAYPPELEEEWQRISQKMKAFLRAFSLSKINLNGVCWYELIPESFLLEWCDLKTKICEHVFENYEKPANYAFLLGLTKVLETIRHQKLNVDATALKNQLGSYKSRAFLKKLNNTEPYINYNLFGTITGRLTTKKGSFPILTLNKEFRSVLKPNNDWFVELDFNAAEFRTFLALKGEDQPQEDLHTWHIKNVFRGIGTREESKKRLFAWMYNPESDDRLLNRFYDRDKILEEYFQVDKVFTKFDRVIESDSRHALNRIIQSTSSDLFLRQMIKVNEILKNTSSNIAFCLHDSIIIDMKDEDKHLLSKLIEIFSDTDFGKYLVNVQAGKSFGNMKKLK